MVKIKMHTKVSSDHLGGIGTDGRIILRWILMKYGVKVWPGFN
jgi:hypothetical protein